MRNENILKYETTLYKLEKNIKRLKGLQIDTASFEKELAQVKLKLSEETKNRVLDSVLTVFSNEAYVMATSKLEKILFNLNAYEIYLKIKSYIKYLRYFIMSDDLDISELGETSTSLIDVLNNIKNSEALDYEIERSLIDEIYELTLEFIKLEIKKTGQSRILAEIQKDELHTLNLDKAISTELSRLNLKDKKYNRLNYLLAKANAEGLNATYVDFDIISSLITCNLNKEEKNKLLKNLKGTETTCDRRLASLQSDINTTKTRLEKLKEELEKKRDIIKNETILAIISGGITTSLITSSIIGSLKMSTHREFKNTITTTTIDKTGVEEKYSENTLDKTYFCKIKPYQSTDDSYERIIEKYDVSGLESLSIPEYLELNFENLGIIKEEIIESKDNLSLSDLYNDVYYAIERIKVDTSDFQDISPAEKRYNYTLGWALTNIFIFFIIHVIISLITNEEIFPFLNIYELKKDLKRLKEIEQEETTSREELEMLEYKYRKFILDNKNIMEYVKNILPSIEERAQTQDSANLNDTLTYLRKYLTILKTNLNDIPTTLNNNQKRLTKLK